MLRCFRKLTVGSLFLLIFIEINANGGSNTSPCLEKWQNFYLLDDFSLNGTNVSDGSEEGRSVGRNDNNVNENIGQKILDTPPCLEKWQKFQSPYNVYPNDTNSGDAPEGKDTSDLVPGKLYSKEWQYDVEIRNVVRDAYDNNDLFFNNI